MYKKFLYVSTTQDFNVPVVRYGLKRRRVLKRNVVPSIFPWNSEDWDEHLKEIPPKSIKTKVLPATSGTIPDRYF